LYTEAIDLDPTDKTYWCNRAIARIKLEEYGYALNDASELRGLLVWAVSSSNDLIISGQAIELDPTYAKAYYRCVHLPYCNQIVAY
jgi:serine/threonine-protein phosphatase 5